MDEARFEALRMMCGFVVVHQSVHRSEVCRGEIERGGFRYIYIYHQEWSVEFFFLFFFRQSVHHSPSDGPPPPAPVFLENAAKEESERNGDDYSEEEEDDDDDEEDDDDEGDEGGDAGTAKDGAAPAAEEEEEEEEEEQELEDNALLFARRDTSRERERERERGRGRMRGSKDRRPSFFTARSSSPTRAALRDARHRHMASHENVAHTDRRVRGAMVTPATVTPATPPLPRLNPHDDE